MWLVRMILRINHSAPREENNESVRKKKKSDHSGFMYANPKKVDKIEWEFCFFLTWDLLYAALQF